MAVLGDDEVDIGLERFQVCQALFVGRARAVVVRRHLEHRLDIGLGLERNIRRHPLRSDQLELGGCLLYTSDAADE